MMTKAKLTLDDQLAEFTNRALEGGLSAQDEATLAPHTELRDLEETVLRLRESIPNEDPGEEVVSRMWGVIEKQSDWKESKPFWQTLKETFQPRTSWQSRRSRQRWTLGVSIAVIMVLLLVILPFMDGINSGLPGTSGGQISSQLVFGTLGVLILLALWLFRRR